MTEEEARVIAEEYVFKQGLNPCRVIAVRRIPKMNEDSGEALGDEWVVQFIFDCDEDCSASHALVIVDDATGQAEAFETL